MCVCVCVGGGGGLLNPPLVPGVGTKHLGPARVKGLKKVKTFLKMSIGFKCRGPKVVLRFCSFLGCVHFGTAGTNKEK